MRFEDFVNMDYRVSLGKSAHSIMVENKQKGRKSSNLVVCMEYPVRWQTPLPFFQNSSSPSGNYALVPRSYGAGHGYYAPYYTSRADLQLRAAILRNLVNR